MSQSNTSQPRTSQPEPQEIPELAPLREEISLDPEDWSGMRDLAHRMVDEMMTYLETSSERPTWQRIPESVKQTLTGPPPTQGQDATEVYQEFVDQVLPYPIGNIHPRFWGWVNGTGTPIGAMAEMLAASLNPNVGGFEQSAVYVELQVLEWFRQLLGFPETASGLLVSGGSMANLLGLTVARHARAGFDIRREGLQGDQPRLTVYASQETHSSVQKAVEMLGLGSASLRKVPTYNDYRVNLEKLIEMIQEDREQGLRPICVVGNAGTVNTGAFDDLEALRRICDANGLWLHVDGAFGALAALSPRLAPQVRGLELADSVAFDLHKWMYMPYDVGCIMVRQREDHRATFRLVPEYLKPLGGGIPSGGTMFADYGVELSRGFRALKVWMSIKTHGFERYAQLIEQNVKQARYVAALVEANPHLELITPVSLNIVCLRYRISGRSDEQLNEINRKILISLHEDGIAVPSMTDLGGKSCMRVAITNHRTQREDLDLLIRETVRLGQAHSTSAPQEIPVLQEN